ncbi:MAG: sigma-70 family RNA polymerase sigma factor [Dehalococcoidia bacterium]
MDETREARVERFRVLFEANHGPVRAYAGRRCGRSEDAEDVVSETFAVAWRRLNDVPAEASLPWLYGVARKVLANQRRGQRRWLGLVERIRQQPQDVSTPESDGPPVVDALRTLRPDDQEVLRLAAWEGLSHSEIGSALGISTNAATIRIHRARKRLGEALANGPGGMRNDVATAGQGSKQEEIRP